MCAQDHYAVGGGDRGTIELLHERALGEFSSKLTFSVVDLPHGLLFINYKRNLSCKASGIKHTACNLSSSKLRTVSCQPHSSIKRTLMAQAVLLEKVMKGILVSWVTPFLVLFLEEASENNCWLTGHV